MRGKHCPCRPHPRHHRNIPAYAGKTISRALCTVGSWEHPRVCGENAGEPCWNAASAGTSPRMRGKQVRIRQAGANRRNIPAYAGKTHPTYSGYTWAAEHPRVCGENSVVGEYSNVVGGTSPRMRGKLTVVSGNTGIVRNIPAYAGKTTLSELRKSAEAEHPRVCGENFVPGLMPLWEIGTSPRMRGKRPKSQEIFRTHRNIPAYAGKTPMGSPT